MAAAVRYSRLIKTHCEPETSELVQRAARARGMKPSEYLRQALRTALQLDGIDPATDCPDCGGRSVTRAFDASATIGAKFATQVQRNENGKWVGLDGPLHPEDEPTLNQVHRKQRHSL